MGKAKYKLLEKMLLILYSDEGKTQRSKTCDVCVKLNNSSASVFSIENSQQNENWTSMYIYSNFFLDIYSKNIKMRFWKDVYSL